MFVYLGGALFLLVKVAASASSLYELISGIRKHHRVQVGTFILLVLYVCVLLSVGGLAWMLSTVDWDKL